MSRDEGLNRNALTWVVEVNRDAESRLIVLAAAQSRMPGGFAYETGATGCLCYETRKVSVRSPAFLCAAQAHCSGALEYDLREA